MVSSVSIQGKYNTALSWREIHRQRFYHLLISVTTVVRISSSLAQCNRDRRVVSSVRLR